MSRLNIGLLLLVLVPDILSANLPPGFSRCNRDQPDLKECVYRAARDGVSKLERLTKELKLPNVNPFEVPEATIGSGAGTVAIEQKFHDCKLYGFNQTEVTKFVFDFEKKTLTGGVVIPELQMLCRYELDGRVLLLPVKGTGPSTIILKDLRVSCDFKYEEFKKKGNTHIRLVSGDMALYPGLITFDFENLFNGEKNLGDNINKVLNDNWKEVFAEVQDGYVEIVKTIYVSLANSFFAKISLEEAFE